MRETSPAGLLTALVVSAVFLLLALLAMESARSGRVDPQAARALRESAEALRALPDGSSLLLVRDGERTGTFAGEPAPGVPAGPFEAEWTVQPLRWDPARARFLPAVGGEARDLARVTLRVRRRGAAVPGAPLSRTLLLASPLPP